MIELTIPPPETSAIVLDRVVILHSEHSAATVLAKVSDQTLTIGKPSTRWSSAWPLPPESAMNQRAMVTAVDSREGGPPMFAITVLSSCVGPRNMAMIGTPAALYADSTDAHPSVGGIPDKDTALGCRPRARVRAAVSVAGLAD